MHHLPLCVLLLLLWYHWAFKEFVTDAEQQHWWGFGFYLQVGGAAQAESTEELDLCTRRDGGKKTGSVWERNHYLNSMFAALRGYYTQKQSEGKEETQSAARGGRFSFDLDLSVHSLHGERFKGRVLLWLVNASWGQALAKWGGFCGNQSAHTVVDKTTLPQRTI